MDRRSTGDEVATAAGVSAVVVAAVGAVAGGARLAQRRRERRDPAHSRTDLDARAIRQLAESAPPAKWDGKPDGPTDLHGPAFGYALRQSISGFRADRCTDIAGTLVYHSVLAIGPALLVVLAVFGLLSPGAVDTLTGRVLQPVRDSSPAVAQTVQGVIEAASSTPAAGLGLAVGIAGAIWSASGYVRAFGRALNRVYEVAEGRPVWKRWPAQLLLTIAIVVLVVIGALLLVSTGPFVEQIAEGLGLGGPAYTAYRFVKWPVLALVAVAALALLYAFSSNVRQPGFRWTSPGAILALLVWAAATAGLGIYLSATGGTKYSGTYGPIAGVVIGLLWLWITNLALLLGAEFDAELERARELQAGLAAEHRIQLPPRVIDDAEDKAERHAEAVRSAARLRRSRGRVD